MSKIAQETQSVIHFMILLGCLSAYKVVGLTNYPEFEDRPSMNFTSYDLNEQECPQTSYYFPDDQQTTNYLRLQPPVPDLDEFTICGWYTLFSDPEYDNWFHYSTLNEIDAFGFQLQHSGIVLFMNGLVLLENIPLSINTEYHICFATFASSTANSYLFIDGQLEDVFHGEPGVIEGGGILIMGNRPYFYGEKFGDEHHSARGKMFNVMVWNRVLTFEEITSMYMNPCFCAPDYLLAAETKNIVINGDVSALPTQICPIE